MLGGPIVETKWKGQKAKEVENTGFKVWYTGATPGRYGVGILIGRSLKDGVVEVRRQGNRIILVWMVVRFGYECNQCLCPIGRP